MHKAFKAENQGSAQHCHLAPRAACSRECRFCHLLHCLINPLGAAADALTGLQLLQGGHQAQASGGPGQGPRARGQGSSHPPGDVPTGLPGPAPPGLPSVCWLAAGSASPGEACGAWKHSECVGNKSMGSFCRAVFAAAS